MARAWAGWLALTLVALLAAGGAASGPGGRLWLGAPSAGGALAVLGAVASLVRVAGSAAGRPLVGLLPLPLLLLAGAPIPGLALLTGPVLWALALAGAVVVLRERGSTPPAWVFFPLVLVVHSAAAARVQVEVGPRGDEPHYLMVADSLLRDGDLALDEDYREARYAAFHDAPLAPHYRLRGKDGRIYSLHALGLSVLVLPAYALAGYAGASFFMALLTAWTAREIRDLARVVAGPRVGEAAGWAVALSPPLLHYAGLVFTEVPAALCIALVFNRGLSGTAGRGALLACGTAVAVLPWLNVRYALPAALLALFLLRGFGPRRAVEWAVPAAASVVGVAFYHQAVYGFLDPRRVYGRRPEFSPATLLEGLPGLLLDQEFGLMVYAPVLALALPGLWRLARERGRLGVAMAAVVLATVLTAGTWHMWRGGWNPPARFLTPLVGPLAVGAAVAAGGGLGPGRALLVGWSLWTGVAGAWSPRLVHRDRDGDAPFFRRFSGASEWTRVLPSYVIAEDAPDRHRLAGVWAAALAAAVAHRGPTTGGSVALAVAGLGIAAGVSDGVAVEDRPARDALRLVGEPALGVPGWSRERAAAGRWRPDRPIVYEPHRWPLGRPLLPRLELRPGSYLVSLEVDQPPGMASPELVVEFERGGAHLTPLAGVGGRLSGRVVVDRPGPHTLRLRGGGPLTVKELQVRVDLVAPAPDPSSWSVPARPGRLVGGPQPCPAGPV